MNDNIEKIIEKFYFYFKKGLTFDCTNPKNETEVLYDIGNLNIINNKNKFSIYKKEANKPAFIYDYKNKRYFMILNIEGGRNHRYKLYTNNITDPKIIRTLDKELEIQLNELIDSKYYSNLKK